MKLCVCKVTNFNRYLWVFILANLASNAIIVTKCPYSKFLGKILLNASVSNTSLSAYSLTDLPPTCLSVSSPTRLSLSPLSQLSVSGSGTVWFCTQSLHITLYCVMVIRHTYTELPGTDPFFPTTSSHITVVAVGQSP